MNSRKQNKAAGEIMATEEKKEVVFDDGRIESIEEFQSPEAL